MTTEQFIRDPNWAAFIPEDRDAPRSRSLPTHEDCSRLDVEATATHLRKGGTLGSMPGYEERPGQIDMCGAIANAFNRREHLMIEAGTGVGKSLAYLVPAIRWAWSNDTPVIISTATRNLQSQLIGSDIPRAVKTLGDDSAKFKVALLKGRNNYVCLKAVDELFRAEAENLKLYKRSDLSELMEWLQRTKDGDLDYFDGMSRGPITCPGDECSSRRCPFFSRCFVYKARKRAAEAHLVIANHSLVLAEATSPGSGILPGYGRLILDEAHNLEDVATEYFSEEFSVPELSRIMRRLLKHYHAATGKANDILRAAERLELFIGTLLSESRDVVRYKAELYYWADVAELTRLQNGLERPLIELVHHLHDVLDQTEDLDLAQRLNAAANSLLAFANTTAFVLKGDQPTHAYWVERRTDSRVPYVRAVAAPISVAEDLNTALYSPKDSVILCSATLRVGNDFNYMAKRLGCGERFSFLTAESPFDYFRQAYVAALDYLPDLTRNLGEYASAVAETLKDIFAITHGRGLVLFTSYEMMRAVADRAYLPLQLAGIRLLVQGEGLSREAITRHLREDANTVVFGAQSFWEGVDVAGEALSCVVITRLPFAQVGDPMVEARAEKIERENGHGSSFRNYTLPEAVIKFRQGFGRLIRTKSDRGVVIVTDSRIVTKSYGATFRKSIPATIHAISDSTELLSRVRDFLDD